MADRDVPPPHADRLTRRIEALREPLIQLWGWPGSGRSALLEELLARGGRRAVGLSLGDLAGEREAREALASARAAGARMLVAAACPPESAEAVARWLRPGEQLVFATTRRLHLPLPCAVLDPQELLLTPRELAVLWHLLAGSEPDPVVIAGLHRASDGWYLPLKLVLEATGGAGLAGAGEAELLAVREVRALLRHEVLEELDAEERQALEAWVEAPAGGGVGDIPGGGEGRRRLIERRGLWVEGPEGDEPPRLLAAFLARERRRRSAPARPAGAGEPPAPSERPEHPETTAPVTYVLDLLGEPVARRRVDGEEHELDWRLRRSFQVLAYLASSPKLQAPREDLIEAIWPKEGERTIDRNFHPTLSHLRRALGGDRRTGGMPPLLLHGGVYRLNPEVTWEIDVVEFRRQLDEGRARLERGEDKVAAVVWESAWRRYRGPFLQGLYEGWVHARREAYQRLYLDLLRDLGDLLVRLERPAEALDAYRAVLVEDPLQERIHLAVMRLYARQGRRDLVRRQYDKLCAQLLDDLGVEPMLETTKEYHQLMGGEAAGGGGLGGGLRRVLPA